MHPALIPRRTLAALNALNALTALTRPRHALTSLLGAALLLSCVAVADPDRGSATRRTVLPGTAAEWTRPTRDDSAPLRAFDRPAQRWLPGHRGVDLAALPGDPVLAPRGGVVTFAGPVADRPVLTLTHDDGLRSSLEPMSASVAVGDRV